VGQALSAFFEGQTGGLFAPGQVDTQAQQPMLASIDRFVPAEEAHSCLAPQARRWLSHSAMLGGGVEGGARGQGSWQ
jgi:hypothetical protein